mmetsp:Transcript_19939/g.57146  ORF Transcript_19939/g.57146 Transcript_19939/m.57146 type:complete len:128 (+) Transcript_19939:841-1224(+)
MDTEEDWWAQQSEHDSMKMDKVQAKGWGSQQEEYKSWHDSKSKASRSQGSQGASEDEGWWAQQLQPVHRRRRPRTPPGGPSGDPGPGPSSSSSATPTIPTAPPTTANARLEGILALMGWAPEPATKQ